MKLKDKVIEEQTLEQAEPEEPPAPEMAEVEVPIIPMRLIPIERGTVVVIQGDIEDGLAEGCAQHIKAENPHWEGPLLVVPEGVDIKHMPEAMAKSLYRKLHALFAEAEAAKEKVDE